MMCKIVLRKRENGRSNLCLRCTRVRGIRPFFLRDWTEGTAADSGCCLCLETFWSKGVALGMRNVTMRIGQECSLNKASEKVPISKAKKHPFRPQNW